MPDVSVLMPARNARRYIREAISSVLSQHGVDLELIVIDDGSSDDTIAIVRSIEDNRIRIISNPRSGIAAALNAGLEAALGKYVARCDADDLYPPDRLNWQHAWLMRETEFGAIAGAFDALNAGGKIAVPLNAETTALEITQELRAGITRTSLCTFLCHTDLARDIGGFREFFVTAEDIDFQLRFSEVARVWFDPRVVYYYRVHDASITHQQASESRIFFENMARELQRQRLLSGLDDLQRGETPPVPQVTSQKPSSAKTQFSNYLVGSSWRAYREGRFRDAQRFAWQACRTSPGSFAFWRNLFVLYTKCLLHIFSTRKS